MENTIQDEESAYYSEEAENVKKEISQYIEDHRQCIQTVWVRKAKLFSTFKRNSIILSCSDTVCVKESSLNAKKIKIEGERITEDNPLLPFVCCLQNIHLKAGTTYEYLHVNGVLAREWTCKLRSNFLIYDTFIYLEGIIGNKHV